jgi:hypothetical protein
MTCDQVRELIDDLAAGRLTGARRDAALAHIAGCAECTADLEAARALAVPLAGLPRSIEPPRDLWPAIAARTGNQVAPGSTPLTRHRPLLAIAAALALVAGSSAVTMLVMRDSGPERGPLTAAPAAPAAPAGSAAPARFEARYVAETRELADLLERQRDLLAPETVAALERNLAIIDSAIADSRAALAADPSNGELELLLRAGYEQKVALLQQATRLARES